MIKDEKHKHCDLVDTWGLLGIHSVILRVLKHGFYPVEYTWASVRIHTVNGQWTLSLKSLSST